MCYLTIGVIALCRLRRTTHYSTVSLGEQQELRRMPIPKPKSYGILLVEEDSGDERLERPLSAATVGAPTPTYNENSVQDDRQRHNHTGNG